MGENLPAAASGGSQRRARSALLANLRQEFRAPVGAVLEYCSMLIEDAATVADEGFRADLDKIHAAGLRLAAMVENLLAPDRLAAPRQSGEAEAFAASVRHELRTPLNHIIGYGELLLEDAGELGAAHLAPDLQRLVAAGKSLLGQIDDLLKLAQMEGGSGEVEIGRGTARVMIKDVVAAIRPLGGEAGRRGPEPGKVLVVDDNEMNRDVLARRLERQGHRVAVAGDGEEALARVRAEDFDLVLLDMVMPKLNGFEVLDRMKADAGLRDLPVIMVTSLDETVSVVRCIELGAEDYLTKPFNPIVLDARIGACLEKKHLRDREVLHRRQIEEEKRRTEQLLRVILPDEIVEELKATDQVRPRRYPDVAVLFTDVVGFTSYCDGAEPEEVLAALQELVEAFEAITERHGLEKIKTIGDAFMATAGLLVPVDDPVLSSVRCGLEMIAACGRLAAGWQVRVGVHCGEVMAGIVGHDKYQFDVWGDTVNTASRMESNGVPAAVTLSRTAWERVAGACRGHSRGTLAIKGKGEMEMWVVEGLREGGASP
jgi:adenylate cyclase